MTTAMKLAVRLSEIRQRLNEIAGLDDDGMTDEVRAEADKLATEFKNAETQHRSALIAEGDEQRAAAGEFGNGDGEPAEVRALMDRVTIGDYLAPAAAGIGIVGAAAELAGALEVPTHGPSGGRGRPVDGARARARGATGGAGAASVHHHGRRTTGRKCSGRSCKGCSVRGSWTRSACAWIPSRRAEPNGRSWRPG